jgi:hypothetical protein
MVVAGLEYVVAGFQFAFEMMICGLIWQSHGCPIFMAKTTLSQ